MVDEMKLSAGTDVAMETASCNTFEVPLTANCDQRPPTCMTGHSRHTSTNFNTSDMEHRFVQRVFGSGTGKENICAML
jgi:hypothetical protein